MKVKPAQSDQKDLIYETILKVVEPEIKKLKDFMHFQNKATLKFVEYITKIDKEKRKPSESFVWLMVQILDMLALLDVLKNMKASLNNDYSFYKRASGMAKKMSAQTDITQAKEQHELAMFLAKQHSITTELKEEFAKSESGYQEVLALIANSCAERIEEERYVTPTEKFRLLRVLPYLLFLIDSDDPKRSLLKIKSIKLERFAKIFRKFPIVPLYGDMQTTIVNILERSPSFNEETWSVGKVSDTKLAVDYEIIHHLSDVRRDYNMYLSAFNNLVKEVKLQLKNNSTTGKVPESLAKEVRRLVLQGFSYLSDWTGRVLSQAAWKYAHPNNDESIQATVEYERVIRYNYTTDESFALVEFIAMLKSLASIMLKEDAILSPIIKSCIHDEVQEFIQGSQFRDLIRVNSKAKSTKKTAREELLLLRSIASDWKDGQEPEDPVLRGEKITTTEKPSIPIRGAPPSPTQLELIRSMIYAFLTQRGKKEQFNEKDFSDSHVKALKEFYQSSFYYPYLTGYSNTIKNMTDLGDLWYREFYLELTKCLQFEIDTSLAWSLCDRVLTSTNTAMIECVLFPFDIYNDAAQRALTSLNQRFLFDEIEAEVNLAFDQLIYKLSDKCFNYYKVKASSITIDKDYRQLLENEMLEKISRFHAPKSRLSVILNQHHFQLLGRSIDINGLISQRMNNYIRKNLDYAITKFEASPITSIIEFESLFNVIKLTHTLMVQDGLTLDPWDIILAEIDTSGSLASNHGRIVLHTLFEIVSDLGAHFVYNASTQRFIRAASLGREEENIPRGAMPKPNIPFLYGNKHLTLSFSTVAELTSSFFGVQHIQSIIRVIGKRTVLLLVDQILQNMELKLHNVLIPYVTEVVKGMPGDKTNLPIYAYGTMGGFTYFRAKLADIERYPELVTDVFQHFREWGNCIALLDLFDRSLGPYDCFVHLQSAPFLGKVPDKKTTKKESVSNVTPLSKTISSLQTFLQKKTEIARSPSTLPLLSSSANQAERIYSLSKDRHSLFKLSLFGIDMMLNKNKDGEVASLWGVDSNIADSDIIPIDSTTEFYRIWSALLFVFLLDTEDNIQLQKSSMELFGDGIHFAGCTIIYFLAQHHRFEALDFSYHLLRMYEVLSTDEPIVLSFLERLKKVKDINSYVFGLLENNLPSETESDLIFHPPETEPTGKKFLHGTTN